MIQTGTCMTCTQCGNNTGCGVRSGAQTSDVHVRVRAPPSVWRNGARFRGAYSALIFALAQATAASIFAMTAGFVVGSHVASRAARST